MNQSSTLNSTDLAVPQFHMRHLLHGCSLVAVATVSFVTLPLGDAMLTLAALAAIWQLMEESRRCSHYYDTTRNTVGAAGELVRAGCRVEIAWRNTMAASLVGLIVLRCWVPIQHWQVDVATLNQGDGADRFLLSLLLIFVLLGGKAPASPVTRSVVRSPWRWAWAIGVLLVGLAVLADSLIVEYMVHAACASSDYDQVASVHPTRLGVMAADVQAAAIRETSRAVFTGVNVFSAAVTALISAALGVLGSLWIAQLVLAPQKHWFVAKLSVAGMLFAFGVTGGVTFLAWLYMGGFELFAAAFNRVSPGAGMEHVFPIAAIVMLASASCYRLARSDRPVQRIGKAPTQTLVMAAALVAAAFGYRLYDDLAQGPYNLNDIHRDGWLGVGHYLQLCLSPTFAIHSAVTLAAWSVLFRRWHSGPDPLVLQSVSVRPLRFGFAWMLVMLAFAVAGMVAVWASFAVYLGPWDQLPTISSWLS